MVIMKRLHVILISFLLAAAAVRAQAPSTTTISDVVYRADGTSASGTLLISWPAFESAGGQAVAAGSKSVTLGAGGALNVALVPNEGATPSGTYYKVVYKLDDGSTSQELWSVPNVPTTTIAAIRSTVVPAGVAIQVASRQYVDTQLAAVTGSRFHNVRYCDQFGGSDAGAKITACIADLPATGGTADARGLEGAQTWAADPFLGVGSKKVRLVVGGASTHTVNVNTAVPASLVVEFTSGAVLSVPTGVTVTWNGGIEAHENEQVFALAGTGKVQFASNRGLHRVSAKWWGAKGDSATDDTAKLQAALDALPTAALITDGNVNPNSSQSQVWVPAGDFVITAPLNITRNAICLMGAGEGTRIRNSTSGSDVLRINHGASTALFYPCIRDLTLRGTGTGSRAIYANATKLLHISRVSTYNHQGPALYMESTNGVYSGNVFANIENLEAEPGSGAAVTAIYDKGGRSNTYRNVTARVAEIGMHFENVVGNTVIGGYIESNINGTTKTGIKRSDSHTPTPAGSASPPWSLSVIGTYFENNTNYSVDADAGCIVHLQNIQADGGVDAATDSPTRVFRLNGGGTIDGMRAVTAKITSSQGIVRARNAWGIYGVHSQLRIEGLNEFPLPYTTSGNTATKSWFDTDPTWTCAGAPNPGVVSFDSGTFFFGIGSKKAVYPSAASTFGDSRCRMDNAITSVVSGDWLGAYAALKFGTGSKQMSLTLRNNGGASETIHDLIFVTDTTDWMVFSLKGRVPSGVTSAALFLAANGEALGASVDTWTGGVAIAKNATPVMYNTEWAARGNYDVDFHAARFRSGVFHNFLVIGDGSGNDYLEAVEEAGNPACAAGDYKIWATSSSNTWKKCENGAVSDLDTGGAGSGDNISANGTAATDADFDDATPAAPSNAVNVKWQKDALTPNNLSAYLLLTDVDGAGVGVSGGELVAASTEANFLADGGATSLACGASAEGKVQVLDDGYVQYCDGATTSGLHKAAALDLANVFTDHQSLDNQKELRLREADAGGDNYIGFRANSSIVSDLSLTWNVIGQCAGANGGNLTINASNEIVCQDDDGGAGSGDNLSVNGVAATDADFDDSTPAAPADGVNVRWQKDAGSPNNLSANLPFATTSQAGGVSTGTQTLGGQKTVSAADTGTGNVAALTAIADSQNSSGTRASLYGLDILTEQTVGGGTVTDAYGARIRSLVESAGTITNAYGLRLEPQTVGTGAGNFDMDSGTATSSFTTILQNTYIKVAAATFKLKDPSTSKNTALNGTVQISNTSGSLFGYGVYGAVETTHASGDITQANAFGGDAYHSGAGTVTDLQGGLASAFVLSSGGNVTRLTGLETFASMGSANTVTGMHGVRVRSNSRSAGTVTTNYGIKIENQAGVGTTNYALFTGAGLVRLGDDLDFGTDNADDIGASGANRPRTGYFGTSVVTPTVNATTALQTNATTRIDSSGNVNNVTLNVEGTGNAVTTVSKIWFDGAGCQNTTALLNWDTPTAAAAVAACRTGTNTQQGTLDFATDSGSLTAQRKFRLPSDWAAGSNIDALVTWNTAAIVNDVVWQIAIACAADAESDDPAFTDDVFTADTAKGTANQLNDTVSNTVTTTGTCAAGEMAYVRIKRDAAHASDTLAAATTARLIGVELAIRRTQ